MPVAKPKKSPIKKVEEKKPESSHIKLPFEIDVHQLLLHSRQLHVTGIISEKTVQPVINQLMGLQLISDDPIVMWINSGGGSLSDGFALVDAMRMSKVPIFTVIRGWACSMGGIISVAGHKRYMTENSVWMAHDIRAGGYDYGEKIIARVEEIKVWQKQAFEFLANNTGLTPKDLEKARHEELWLHPDQCLEKGVVDHVFKLERVAK